MKDIYVNKEGVICACTVEVPKEPDWYAHKYWIHHHKAPVKIPGAYDADMTKYQSAIQACKESAVPFEEQQDAKATLLPKHLFPTVPDTFYQIEADWEIVECCAHDSCHVNAGCEHCKEPIKLARLKVPAPTVATDNSVEETGTIYGVIQDAISNFEMPDGRKLTDFLTPEGEESIVYGLRTTELITEDVIDRLNDEGFTVVRKASPVEEHGELYQIFRNGADIKIYKNGKLLEPNVNFNSLSIRCAPVEEEQEQFLLHLVDVVACFTSEQNQYYATSVRMDLINKARETFKPKDTAHQTKPG